MAREILGHCPCPECGGAAEVKPQKNGLAYRWCLDCHAQYFPRTVEASDRLKAKCGAGTVTAPAPAPKPAQAPDPAKPKPAPKPAQAPVPAPAQAPAPAPAQAKPRTSGNPFDFLLNGTK